MSRNIKLVDGNSTGIKKPAKVEKRRRLINIVVILSILALAIVAGWYTYQLRSLNETPETAEQESLGVLAPNFTLTDLEGNVFSLSDYRGKVVVIDFIATWCGACRLQMSHYETVWEEYKDEIVLMSIDIDPRESEETLRSFAQEFPYATWIWARDTANLLSIYQVSGIPKTVVIDQDGYIRFTYVGVVTASLLTQQINQLLKS